MDTSSYTHLCRAGHADIVENLAPGGVVLILSEVNTEIENGRDKYPGIPAVSDVCWAEITCLRPDEEWTAIRVKAALGGGQKQHLGEAAVIACAHHRGLIAVLDDSAAVEQARRLQVTSIGTMWIAIEAYKSLYGKEKDPVIRLVDDLLATEMYLPIGSGEELFVWAYHQQILP
jgi:predicted nucleic acid-binding protein